MAKVPFIDLALAEDEKGPSGFQNWKCKGGRMLIPLDGATASTTTTKKNHLFFPLQNAAPLSTKAKRPLEPPIGQGENEEAVKNMQ